MVIKGFTPRPRAYNMLIGYFSKMGKMSQAKELMNEMQRKGVSPTSSTYDILICGWCKLSRMPDLGRTLKVSYRAEAKKLFTEMNDRGFLPCESTLFHISSTFATPGKKADARMLLKSTYKRKRE